MKNSFKCLKCPKCSKLPRIFSYISDIQNIKLYKMVCKNECSSTFSVRNKKVATELWNSYVINFNKNLAKA